MVATITTVAVDGRRIIAGTKDGVIRVSNDLCKTWKRSSVITAGEIIVDIDAVGTQWLIVSTRTLPAPNNTVMVDQIQVHSINRADFSDPRLLRRFALKDPLHSFLSNGIRAQALGGFTVTMETYRLKPGAPKWQKTGETPPAACPRTVHDVAHTQVFCVTSSNSILKLDDGGKLAVEFAAN